MRPIRELPSEEARRLHGVLFDMDDTLLDHGTLRPEAYQALFQLRDAGLQLMVVTGRPATWGCVLVRQWPILAAVTENGAVAVHREGRAVRFIDPVPATERAARRARLQAMAAELTQRFPELESADEYDARIADLAFDIGERHPVAPEVVREALALAEARGFRTTASSVNIHLTLDGDDKASGAVRVLGVLAGADPTVARYRYAYLGDSGNDAACFAAFHTTIAPSNFIGRPTIVPRYITTAARGAGFAEAARTIVAARDRA